MQQQQKTNRKKQKEFNSEFKLLLFSKLENIGIKPSNINEEGMNEKIDPIIIESFQAHYQSENITKGKRLRYLRKKVRSWYSQKKIELTKLNHLTSGRKTKRNGGGGRKNRTDFDTDYKIYKSFASQCLEGKSFTFEAIRDHYEFFLRESGLYRVKGDEISDNDDRIEIDVNEYVVRCFKKRWNITRSKEGIITAYDQEQTICNHSIVVAQIFTLKTLLNKHIDYISHHDQVSMFYSSSKSYVYTTTQTKTTNG